MITKLSLRNIKSHRDTTIELNNLTLLTGVNSSGKTTLMQALLLLRQSHLKNRLTDGLELNDELVEIGISSDIFYKMAKNQEMEIAFYHNDEAFSFKYDMSFQNSNTNFVKKLAYSANATAEKLNTISIFNTQFQYVSASRIGGESIFKKKDYEVENLKQVSKSFGRGELAAQYLLKYGTDECMDLIDGINSTLEEEVMKWENRISPRITFSIIDDKSGNIIIKYGYESSDSSVKYIDNISAENMGFGISYSFSLLVALLSAKPGAVVLIENPEAHLHPQAQSEIAKLISLVAQNGVQVIIETHSDHILNGVLVNCKRYEQEGKGIDKSNVAIYYMQGKDKDHATITQKIEVLKDGAIDYQPDGFFDRDEKDAFYLSGFDYE
ncbi:MAG: DUF3696 domain-containing protein [Phocaeicola sp.]